MRINRLEITNFKRFAQASLTLHPQFTLLAGANGVGKTSWLDALSIAMGVWLESPPDTSLQNCKRKLLNSEIRLHPSLEGDRTLFREIPPAIVKATGSIAGQSDVTWARRSGARSDVAFGLLRPAQKLVDALYAQDRRGEKVICPVIAYYGAGRAWLPSNRRVERPGKPSGPALRWAAFYDWCNERIRFDDLKRWFQRETTEMGNRQGRRRPGFDAVVRAVLSCVPDSDRVWFDSDRDDIVLSIAGHAQPFGNLSAGQRTMLGLVADLAIKCVTQNAWLLPEDQLDGDPDTVPRVLRETPGVVLIDELDVHLHPIWQRRVASDLKRNFPSLQFVATSHSPQIIGELQPEEIRLMTMEDAQPQSPGQSFGLDSNEVLQSLMGADALDPGIEREYATLFDLLTQRPLDAAEAKLHALQARLGKTAPLQRATATLDRIRLLGR
jgi:predicted ATP-binding protein involved in virulence